MKQQWFQSSCSVCYCEPNAQEQKNWPDLVSHLLVAQLVLLMMITRDPQARHFLHWRKFKTFQVLYSSVVAHLLFSMPVTILLLLRDC